MDVAKLAVRPAPAPRAASPARLRLLLLLLLLCAGAGGCGPSAPDVADQPPDLSGLAWLDGDTFLGAHDAKVPGRPRVSLLRLPAGADAKSQRLRWEPVALPWPAPGPAMDLESAARVPGTPFVLLAESGQASDKDGGQFRRLFLVEHRDGRLRLRRTTEWPVPVQNVEGTAVARAGDRLVFVYAERAQGLKVTTIRWATITVEPAISFGPFREVTLPSPIPVGPQARPVTDIAVADDGAIYVASAVDPDADDGPYASSVWRVGRVGIGAGGEPEVTVDDRPHRVATADGFKIEGLAVRARPGGPHQVFVGTDDEHFGGALRPLP